MAGLNDLLGGILGTDVETISTPGNKKAYYLPRLLQLMALGGDPTPLTKAQAKALPKSKKFKFAGQFFSAESVSASALQKQALVQQDAQVQQQQQALTSLKDSPLYESLFADSQGGLPNILDPALTELGKRTLGGASQGGLNVNDPVVQAKILGPLALQGTLAQKGLQQQAGANLAQALGGPGSALAQSAAQPLGYYQNIFSGQQAANLNAQQFNANAKNTLEGSLLGLLGISGAGALSYFGGPDSGAQPKQQQSSGAQGLGSGLLSYFGLGG